MRLRPISQQTSVSQGGGRAPALVADTYSLIAGTRSGFTSSPRALASW